MLSRCETLLFSGESDNNHNSHIITTLFLPISMPSVLGLLSSHLLISDTWALSWGCPGKTTFPPNRGRVQPPVPDILNYKGNPALNIITPISNAKYNPLSMKKHAEITHLRAEVCKGSAGGRHSRTRGSSAVGKLELVGCFHEWYARRRGCTGVPCS